MMGTVSNKSQVTALAEQRRDEGDIGEMGAPEIGIVKNDHSAFLPVKAPDNVSHGVGHAPEVYGDMGSLGTELAGRIEDRTREIQAIFNVR